MKSFTLIFKSLFLILVLFVCCSTIANAQIIKGKVVDSKNGDPLIGATVHIENGDTKLNAAVKLDGSYQFKNLLAGTYKLQVKFIGYRTTKEYNVEANQAGIAILNIAMVDNSTALSQVNITEHASRESEKAARSSEKNANNTMNVVSAASIAISPDVIISNVLGRVAGISLDRGNTGDGQHVIIRGMDKKYNTTLINGVKIPSPDNKNRFVPLDIFPADLVERIEVSKTLTPDMEADASGGVVDLVMKSAPDHFKLDGSFGTGYSQLFFDRPFESFDASGINMKSPSEYTPISGQYKVSPNSFPYQNLITTSANALPNVNGNLTIGNRFLHQKLGILFAGSYQRVYAGNNTFQLLQDGVVPPAPDPSSPMTETSFQDGYLRKYSSKIDRGGVITSIDYKFNSRNSINLFTSYILLNEHRVRQTVDLNYGGYSYQGYHWLNSYDYLTETRSDLQNIYNITLKGKHELSQTLKLDWSLVASQAQQQMPDLAEFHIKQADTAVKSKPLIYAHKPGGRSIDSTYLAPAVNYDTLRVGKESRLWRRNTDKDLSAYLNLNKDLSLFGRKGIFSVGVMIRHKTRSNFNDSYTLTPITDPNSIEENYSSVSAARFTFNPPDNAYGSSFSDAGVYSYYENVQAGYGMLKYDLSSKFNVVFGVRVENTLQHYDSSINPALGGQTATITYTDYLPSINAKYSFNDYQALRLAYYGSIYRAVPYELIPSVDLTAEGTPISGNPHLQHTTVDNYDLRYESFPNVLDEFMIGAFYKLITNPIENVESIQNGSLIIMPNNLSDAHNLGFEGVAKKYFGSFGVSVNYTYTNSSITSTKKYQSYPVINPVYVEQTRPLQGQAAHEGNFSLLYKDIKHLLDAQLAFAYTGERINTVSAYKDVDVWEKANLSLDFSAQKTFHKKHIVFVMVNNILNTPYELIIKQNNINNYEGIMKYYYQESPNYTTLEYDKYYTRYSIGVRFKIQ